MLQITIPGGEQWDEDKEEYVYTKERTLRLEHSLVSLSKWESKWCKAFLGKKEKTHEETLDYIKCMTITPNVESEVYDRLTPQNIDEIYNYINAPMTATVISEVGGGKAGRDTITAELIYYWMISLQIPAEYDKWHLNRLITLIRVVSVKNSPPKKMGMGERIRQNAALNASRRARTGSRG